MNSKDKKNIIIGLITGLIVIIILMQFLGFFLSIIGGLIGGAITILLAYNIFKDDIVEEIKTEMKNEKNVINPVDKAIESLIELEEFIALSDKKLENDISLKVTSIIDSLIYIIPKINQEFSSQTITFEVTNLAEEHFPKRIKIFIDLNENDKNSEKNKLISDLENMEALVNRVKDVIKNDSLNKNERESLLNDIKYGAI
ncbi:MAG: hypothetical protein GY932_00745 [Arcobacter sp.]|nr:hypothetical protein [Arcobacter sp.]